MKSFDEKVSNSDYENEGKKHANYLVELQEYKSQIDKLEKDLSIKELEIERLKIQLNKQEISLSSQTTYSPKLLNDDQIPKINFIIEKNKPQENLLKNNKELMKHLEEINVVLFNKTKENEKLYAETNHVKQISMRLQKEIDDYHITLAQQSNLIKEKNLEKEKLEEDIQYLNNQYLEMKKVVNSANKTIEELELKLRNAKEVHKSETISMESVKQLEQLAHILNSQVCV